MSYKENFDLFLNRAKSYFKDEYEEFLVKLKEKPTKYFYLNQLKNNVLNIINNIEGIKITKNKDMYSYDFESIGKHFLYHLGLIYPQDIGSSYVSKVINIDKGSVILDMCSAPGGKAIQFSGVLKESGFLILNEYVNKRALIELSNIERMGFSNYILHNENSRNIALTYQGSVDYCLVDAPCSGEGMIRKNEKVIEDYTLENIKSCAIRQKEILDDAYLTLKNNGYLIYSTCTFSMEENEEVVYYLLEKYPDLKLVDIKLDHSRRGLPFKDLENFKLLRFSFLDNSEGQFIALFKKDGNSINNNLIELKKESCRLAEDFIKHNLEIDNYYLMKKNDEVYLKLQPFIKTNLKTIRQGILIGKIIKNNFIPEHHLYRANILSDKFKYVYDLNDEEYSLYIKGLEFTVDNGSNNYYLIRYKNNSLGFGKLSEGRMKNKYPKGLREI